MNKDYYQILGLSQGASDIEIKKAYRRLAMEYHPDRNPGKEQWANEKFKEINEAYGVLGDPEKKRQYDQFGRVGNVGDLFSSPYTRSTFEDLMADFGGSGLRFDFLDDVFGDLLRGSSYSFRKFGRGTGGKRGARFETPQGIDLDELFGQSQGVQPQPIIYEITITKEQATRGVEKDLNRGGKKLKVKIPAGIKSGTKVRLKNARQITDGQPGDILIQVKVK